MVQLTRNAPLGGFRSLTTADGGLALDTTRKFLAFPQGTAWARIVAREFATAEAALVLLCPWLWILKTQDDLTTATDYSEEAQDASATTEVSLDALGTAAQLDYLYVGSRERFAGVWCDVSGDAGEANGNASVLTVKYWKDDSTWAAVSGFTDGTDSGGASMAVDGEVTWTVPTDWLKARLKDTTTPTPSASIVYRGMPLYWTRWQFSAALDAVTRLDQMLAIGRYAAGELTAVDPTLEFAVNRQGGVGGVAFDLAAGTASAVVSVAPLDGQEFTS